MCRGTTSTVAVVLPYQRASAGVARHRLREVLEQQAVARQVIDDAALVVSELVGNAVLHGSPLRHGHLLLEWHDEADGVCLCVIDGGGHTVPAPRNAEPTDSSGRGLGIVDAVARDWGVDRTENRARVWALVTP